MTTKLNQINRIYFDGNENIVIQDIENSVITINKNNPDEINSFFINFSERLSEFETILTKNQNNFNDLNKLLSGFLKENRAVYVTGTGAFNISDLEQKCAKIVGSVIAELNYNLIVGGWEGVDYIVADEYSKTIREQNIRLSSKLAQIVPFNKQPIYKGGNVEYVKEGVMEWIECLKRANVLIIIGGAGGTYDAFEFAKQEMIPTIPFAFTGGDARRAFAEIINDSTSFKIIYSNISIFRNFEFDSDEIRENLKLLLPIIFKQQSFNI